MSLWLNKPRTIDQIISFEKPKFMNVCPMHEIEMWTLLKLSYLYV